MSACRSSECSMQLESLGRQAVSAKREKEVIGIMSIEKKYENTISVKDTGAESRTPIRLRAFIVALASVLFFGVVNIQITMPYDPWVAPPALGYSGALSGASLVTLLCLMFVVNPLIKKMTGRICFEQKDIVVVYSLIVIGGTLMTVWGNGLFLAAVVGIAHQGLSPSPSPGVMSIYRSMSDFLTFRDLDVVRGFWFGGVLNVPWGAWIPVIAVWTSFLVVLLWVTLCIFTVFRRHIQQRSYLAVPLVQIYQAICQTLHQADVQMHQEHLLLLQLA
jgi:hypothetical protein